jgi:hypothetical protein
VTRTRNAHAELELIAYVKAHPGKTLARGRVAQGVPAGLSTVSKVLDRLVETAALPGLEKLAPGRWRYDPPTYQVVAVNGTEGRPRIDEMLVVIGYSKTGLAIARHEDGRLFSLEPL